MINLILKKARTSHNPEEIKAFIEIKRKEIEETNFTNILQYYLTHQKIQNNLKNLFKKSRQILQKSNILISKKPQNTSPKLPLGKIINDEKNFQDFDKNFSLIHKEYEKIMASWKKGEKLNEKPFETNGKFLQTAFFHETSVKNKAKAKSILNKFMIISKKLEKMLDSKSPNSFPKKEDIFFKQQGNNFLQILKEEEDKSSQSLIEEIGCILKNSQNSKYPKTIAEKQEFFSAKEIDRKKKLSDKISNKFQTSDNFNDSNSPKLNIFEKEYFNSKNKQLTLSQKPSHSSNNSGGLFFDSFDANKEKYITISVEELNIQKNEISYEVDEEILKENLLILENIAILIQKTWRGYKTRKIISKYFEMFLEKEENEHEIIYEEEFEDIGVESVHNNAKKGALMSSLEGLEVKFDKEIEKINEFINKKKSEHKQDHISESSLNNKNDQKYLTINNNDGNGNNVEKNLKDIGYIKISNDNDNVAFNCNNSKEIEINKKNMKKSKEREAIIRDVDNENKNDFFINNVDNEIKYEKINFTNKENKYTNDIANKNNIDLEFSCSKKEKENEINLSELRIIFGSEQYLRNFKRQLQKSAILDASQMRFSKLFLLISYLFCVVVYFFIF